MNDNEESRGSTCKYTQPVIVGQTIEVEIVNIGSDGDGVAKIDNYVVFVPKGELKHKYEVKIKKVFQRYAFSTIIQEVE